jgi:type IV secretion system protein VirD4
VVPPSDISRTKPLVRLLLNQIGRRLTEDLHGKNRRHRVLLMLDEFPALGRLDCFESTLASMVGYDLKGVPIAHSLNQIEKAYGPNNSILDKCHVRVCFAQRRAHHEAGIGRARRRDRTESDEELCWPSAIALA